MTVTDGTVLEASHGISPLVTKELPNHQLTRRISDHIMFDSSHNAKMICNCSTTTTNISQLFEGIMIGGCEFHYMVDNESLKVLKPW